MALVGVAAALVAVAVILYRAADVLAAGYTTFGSIVDLAKNEKFARQQEKEAVWAKRIVPRQVKLDHPPDAAAWKEAWNEVFDHFLRERAEATGTEFVPFDPAADYDAYVHGKPRLDGTRSFLRSRGIDLPEGTPDDPPGTPTIYGLSNRKKLHQKAWRIIRRSYAIAVVNVMNAAQKLSVRYAKDEDIRIDKLIRYLNVDTFYFTQGLASNIIELHQALLESDEEILSIRGESTQTSDSQARLEKADWQQDRLESAMGVLIAFANQRVLENKFRKLIRAILFGGAVVAIGAAVFAVAPKLGKSQPLSVTQPTRVTIRVVGNGLGKLCPAGTLLQGVAVGGTWQKPEVVTEEAGSCPAQQLTLNPGQAIAVPVLEPSP